MAEEHKKHHEHKEKHKEKDHKREIKKVVVWQWLTAILAILFIVSIVTGGFKGTTTTKIGAKAAAEKAVNYINANLLQPGMDVKLQSVSEKNGVYNIRINIAGRDYDSYITVDGNLFFPSSFDLNKEVEAPATPQPQVAQKVDVSVDDDPSKGSKDAEVTIIEFSDFQCPYCARFFTQTLPLIDENYIKTGKVRLVYRDFPLSFHQNAQKAAEAAECADEQNKFWEYHDLVFKNQGALSIDDLKKYAANLKLDTAKFDACLDSGKYEEEVKKDFADGQKAGVTGTPAFFVNGKPLVGAQPFSAFKEVIDAELGIKEEVTNVQTAPQAEPANTVTQTAPAGGCGI